MHGGVRMFIHISWINKKRNSDIPAFRKHNVIVLIYSFVEIFIALKFRFDTQTFRVLLLEFSLITDV